MICRLVTVSRSVPREVCIAAYIYMYMYYVCNDDNDI